MSKPTLPSKVELLTFITFVWMLICIVTFGLSDCLTVTFYGLLAWCIFEQQNETK